MANSRDMMQDRTITDFERGVVEAVRKHLTTSATQDQVSSRQDLFAKTIIRQLAALGYLEIINENHNGLVVARWINERE